MKGIVLFYIVLAVINLGSLLAAMYTQNVGMAIFDVFMIVFCLAAASMESKDHEI